MVYWYWSGCMKQAGVNRAIISLKLQYLHIGHTTRLCPPLPAQYVHLCLSTRLNQLLISSGESREKRNKCHCWVMETLPYGRPDQAPSPPPSATPPAKSVFTPATPRPPKLGCENPSGYVNKGGVCVRTWQQRRTCSALYMGAKSLFRSPSPVRPAAGAFLHWHAACSGHVGGGKNRSSDTQPPKMLWTRKRWDSAHTAAV